MHLKPVEDIGAEVHPHTTQSLRVEKGKGYATVERGLYQLEKESWLTIPPARQHNVWADEKGPGLWIYVIYSPPEHPVRLVQETKPPSEKK